MRSRQANTGLVLSPSKARKRRGRDALVKGRIALYITRSTPRLTLNGDAVPMLTAVLALAGMSKSPGSANTPRKLLKASMLTRDW